jgi:hypothetical protein
MLSAKLACAKLLQSDDFADPYACNEHAHRTLLELPRLAQDCYAALVWLTCGLILDEESSTQYRFQACKLFGPDGLPIIGARNSATKVYASTHGQSFDRINVRSTWKLTLQWS